MCRAGAWRTSPEWLLLSQWKQVLSLFRKKSSRSSTRSTPTPGCFAFLCLLSVVRKEPCQEDLHVSAVVVSLCFYLSFALYLNISIDRLVNFLSMAVPQLWGNHKNITFFIQHSCRWLSLCDFVFHQQATFLVFLCNFYRLLFLFLLFWEKI